jgi:hypothetical protein
MLATSSHDDAFPLRPTNQAAAALLSLATLGVAEHLAPGGLTPF